MGTDRLSLKVGKELPVDEICAILGYYTDYSGNSLPTFQDILSVPYAKVTLEDWDR